MARRTAGLPALLVATAIVAASACSGAARHASVSNDYAVPVLASELHGPGTSLGDGFVVPNGAARVGPIVRQKGTWNAVLVVRDDPIAVFRSFVAQGRRHHVGTAGGCSVERGVLGCTSVSQQPDSGSFTDISQLTVEVQWGSALGAPLAHAEVSYRRGTASQSEAFDRIDPLPTGALARVVPEPLPRVGDRLWANGDREIDVLPGTSLVMPGNYVDGCGLFGPSQWLVRVDRNVETVRQAYARAVARAWPNPASGVFGAFELHDHGRAYVRVELCPGN